MKIKKMSILGINTTKSLFTLVIVMCFLMPIFILILSHGFLSPFRDIDVSCLTKQNFILESLIDQCS